MKHNFYFRGWILPTLLLALLLASIAGCTPKNPLVNQRTVTGVTSSRSEAGFVYLRANGFGKNPKEAQEEAIRNAISVVLFQGVPSTSVKRPLINQPGARQAFREFFDPFFAQNGPYLDYAVVTSEIIKDRIKVKSGVQRAVMMKVNYTQLQRMLEQQGIIKRFGI